MMPTIIVWFVACIALVFNETGAFGERSFIRPRPQGFNLARQDAGIHDYINRADRDRNYGNFAITPSYEQSFSNCIAQQLFGTCNALVFSGSRAQERNPTDILADYFGLPADFASAVSTNPIMRTFVIDFDWFMGFDSWRKGVYTRLYAPLVYTQWDLRMCESIIAPGETFHPAGYLGPQRLNPSVLPTSALQALSGTTTFGDMREPLAYGRVCGKNTAVNMADIRFSVGYNPWINATSNVGGELYVSFPTSKSPSARNLFAPMIGNGGHWEVGIELHGQKQFWHAEHDDSHAIFFLQGMLGHLVTTRHQRSYDLKRNGPGSRYMLLEEVASPDVNLAALLETPLVPNQYKQRLIPVINITTLTSCISVPVQAQIAIRMAFYKQDWNLELGYMLWARTAERLEGRDHIINDLYAVKGDAQVYGFVAIGEAIVPLNATQHDATIHAGQGAGNFATGVEFANANADNPTEAPASVQLDSADAVDLGITQTTVNISNPAVLINDSDLNICSGLAPQAVSHMLFIHTGYTWRDNERYSPYVGAGADVEMTSGCVLLRACNNNGAVAQWGVWVKSGVAY